MQPNKLNKMMNRYSGFTLVEVVVAVAIIGVLAAVAWPTFDRYQLKVSRADGIAGLEIAANAMEKCGARTFNYAHDDCTQSVVAVKNSPRGKYLIEIDAATTTARSFTLTATKQVGNKDTECNVKLATNNLGQQGFKRGTSDPVYINTKLVRTCWNK